MKISKLLDYVIAQETLNKKMIKNLVWVNPLSRPSFKFFQQNFVPTFPNSRTN